MWWQIWIGALNNGVWLIIRYISDALNSLADKTRSEFTIIKAANWPTHCYATFLFADSSISAWLSTQMMLLKSVIDHNYCWYASIVVARTFSHTRFPWSWWNVLFIYSVCQSCCWQISRIHVWGFATIRFACEWVMHNKLKRKLSTCKGLKMDLKRGPEVYSTKPQGHCIPVIARV